MDVATHAAQTTVAVATDQPLFCDALGRVVRQWSSARLVGEALDAQTLLELVHTRAPDVLIADPRLAGLEARRLLTHLAAEGLATRALLVGEASDGSEAYELLELGAAGYVTRRTSADELRDALRVIAVGGCYLARAVQNALAGEIRLRAHPPGPRLSPREHEILQRVASGESAPAIAASMYLSTSTVKTHLARLYSKLDVCDRAAAVAVALRSGLLV